MNEKSIESENVGVVFDVNVVQGKEIDGIWQIIWGKNFSIILRGKMFLNHVQN